MPRRPCSPGAVLAFVPILAIAGELALVLMLAAAALTPTQAHAEKADGDKPIAWSGARLTGKRNVGGVDVVELEGKVVVTQGTRTIRADRAVIRQNADGSMSATAHGNPVSYREKRDGVDEYVEAFAQRAEYDGQKKLLELFDQALLRREKDEVRASYISYNTESETYLAEGQRGAKSEGDGRVRGVFQPRPRDTKAEGAKLQPSPAPRGKD
jgi:lipopolysaccharide export system protein LptA